MTSKTMRDTPLFMRNNFKSVGKWGIPIIQKQELSTNGIMLVACSDTRANDNEENKKKGVHFFVDDYCFNGIYDMIEPPCTDWCARWCERSAGQLMVSLLLDL